jgi:hypothetical protein
MRIEVNVEKKYAFIIISLLVVIAGVVIGYAYNSSPADPAVMGHTFNELRDPVTGAMFSSTAKGNYGGGEFVLTLNNGGGSSGNEIFIGPSGSSNTGHIDLAAAQTHIGGQLCFGSNDCKSSWRPTQVSNSGTVWAGGSVCCPSGSVLSGCSGGNDDGRYVIAPKDNCCYAPYLPSGHQVNLYAICLQ